MKTIYLDNNVLIKLVENSNSILNAKVLEILNSQTIRFAASLWNIYEIANSPSREQAINLAIFLDKLKPCWLIDTLQIRRMEVEKFVFDHYYKNGIDKFNPFYEHLSQASIGSTAESIVRDILANPSCLIGLKQQLEDGAIRAQVLQGKDTSLFEKEIFTNLVSSVFPINDPYGKLIDMKTRSEIIDFCYKNKKNFNKNCRIFGVEDLLFKFRKSDRRRVPTQQDSVDLQHQLQALSYCNYFVTEDGFILSGMQYVKKYLSGCTVLKSILEIIVS